jgi:hydrogenase/urease accessory protein HupE
MTPHRLAAVLLVGGSATFLLGAAIGVPTVFTNREPAARLRLLDDNATRWRAAQPLYGLGPLLVAVGVGVLATDASSGVARTAVTIAFLALACGAFAWAWSVYQRAIRIGDFARGTLRRWPFATYVLLTIGGLALVAVGLLADRVAPGVAWVTIAADLVFLAGYLAYADLPPFVFYLLFPAIAAALE